MTDQALLQQQLARIWAGALGVKHVAGDDNFFALGGHSLLGVKMLAALQDSLKLDAELALSDLVEHPTLEEFPRSWKQASWRRKKAARFSPSPMRSPSPPDRQR